jgi:hypothetical protein
VSQLFLLLLQNLVLFTKNRQILSSICVLDFTMRNAESETESVYSKINKDKTLEGHTEYENL